MKKIYHLSNCKTCQKMIAELNNGEGFVLQDIKTERITPEQLEEMRAMAGSYEALFSRKAMKYRSMGLHERTLSETDYQQLILEEYTFLKRPVIIIEDELFAGSTKAIVAAARAKAGLT
jgi:arsenate reductase